MNKLVLGLITLLSFEVLAQASSECGGLKLSSTSLGCVEYRDNYDGDTISVNIAGVHPLFGQSISIRIRGIDTAEIKGQSDCEKEMARFTRDIVAGFLKSAKVIELRDPDRDKYFRIVADVIADGTNIGEELLRRQLAYPYDGGTKQKINWCQYKSASEKI